MGRFQGLGRTQVNVPGELEPLESYLADVLARVQPLGAEKVALGEILGRVLAEDVTATVPLPSFPNSAMDGYAVRAADVRDAAAERPVTLEVIGETAAGSSQRATVRPGTAVRIMTGAPVPSGADTVVPVEMTTQDGARVRIHGALVAGDNIRGVGEDVAAGQPVLRAGQVITAAAVGVIAAVGRDAVRCRRRAAVAVVSTGDELVAPGEELTFGQLHDSNGPMLVALAGAEGAEATQVARVGDDPDALRATLSDAAHSADVVLVSGGVSAGAHDHLPEVLDDLGDCRRAKLAMKPGKPQLLGRVGSCRVLAVPGNPVSAYVSFELFALPLLRALHGRADLHRPVVPAVAAAELRGAAGKRTFLRVRLTTHDGVLLAESAGGQGSHVLSALTRAQGLAEVPEHLSSIPAGEPVRVRLLTDLA